MKRLFAVFCVIAVFAVTHVALAQAPEVYTNETVFVTATGANPLAFPPNATLLPVNQFSPGTPYPTLTDWSCIGSPPGIRLPWGSLTPLVNVQAPFAASGPFNCRIFFIGPGWNAPLSNTNPKPVSPTIVANGEDDYKVLSLTTPAYAVGFVLLTNYAANETVTLTFFDGNSAVIVDSMLGTSQNSFEFVGFRSLKSITSVAINTTGGTSQNEGIVAIWLATFYQVQIDIKPGSFPNSINLGSNGTVPVAILSSAGFDARTVDPLTVQLAGASVPLRGKGTPMASFQDVNGDGLLDLVVHVSTEALTLGIGDTLAVLTATTFGGLPIRGTDTVRIVPPGS